MKRNLLRRLFISIFVLLGVTIVSFLLLRLGGGDPARLLAGSLATDAEIEDMRVRMGLDKSYLSQYFTYLGNILRGDLGYSWSNSMPVTKLIASRLPNTIVLSLVGITWACIFSIVLGIIAGINQGSGIDFGALFFAIIGQSMSPIWLGFMLILLFGVNLHWLPTQGMGGFECLIMPGLCTGFGYAAQQTRLMRSGMVDVLREDYITATRARGVTRKKTYFKYALKNALLPIITNIGSQLGHVFVGSVVIENIFNWPGMGQLLIQAITQRDYELVQSILLISAAMLVVCNLLADILYTVVDPRISLN